MTFHPLPPRGLRAATCLDAPSATAARGHTTTVEVDAVVTSDGRDAVTRRSWCGWASPVLPGCNGDSLPPPRGRLCGTGGRVRSSESDVIEEVITYEAAGSSQAIRRGKSRAEVATDLVNGCDARQEAPNALAAKARTYKRVPAAGRDGLGACACRLVSSRLTIRLATRMNRRWINDQSPMDLQDGREMVANERSATRIDDVALELKLQARGTDLELLARRNYQEIRKVAGCLRFIESVARDGKLTANVIREYHDALTPDYDDAA